MKLFDSTKSAFVAATIFMTAVIAPSAALADGKGEPKECMVTVVRVCTDIDIPIIGTIWICRDVEVTQCDG